MKSDRVDNLFATAIIILLLAWLLCIGMILVKPYFEAKAYNRLTGSNVSTWDAWFLELRIDGQPVK